MTVLAGVDVGGRRKGFHGVMIDDVGVVGIFDHREERRDSRRVVGWLKEFDPAVTAVDSPRSLAPDGERSRPCERKFLATRICSIRATPDRATLEARTDRYYEWIERGLCLYRALEAARLAAIECFPTASWTRWAGPKGTESRARWTRQALAELGLDGVPERTNQDVRDAIAAALTARLYTAGRVESFGEIVVPMPPRVERSDAVLPS